MTKSPKKRTTRLLAFGPALVAICITAYVASGVSIVGSATGASTIDVTGSVSAGMSVTPDTASACTGGTDSTFAIGDFSDGAFHSAASPCTVTWATNSPNGAYVTVDDTNAAPFFCTASCAVASNDSVENVTAAAGGAVLGNDNSGIALTAVTGTPSPTSGANFEPAGSLIANPVGTDTVWAPVDPAPQTICETAAVTTVNQSCSFKFGVDGQGASQTAGSYSGTLNVLATANP